jgi:hypothetical protein
VPSATRPNESDVPHTIKHSIVCLKTHFKLAPFVHNTSKRRCQDTSALRGTQLSPILTGDDARYILLKVVQYSQPHDQRLATGQSRLRLYERRPRVAVAEHKSAHCCTDHIDPTATAIQASTALANLIVTSRAVHARWPWLSVCHLDVAVHSGPNCCAYLRVMELLEHCQKSRVAAPYLRD